MKFIKHSASDIPILTASLASLVRECKWRKSESESGPGDLGRAWGSL